MKRTRGFSFIEIIGALLAAAALVGAIYGLVHYVGEWVKTRDAGIFTAGYDKAKKELAERDKKELEDADRQIAKMLADKLATDTAHAEAQADAKRIHDREVANAKSETAALLARVRSGDLVLRDPGAIVRASGSGQPGAGGVAGCVPTDTAAAAPGGSGQALGGRISDAASEFLLTEADRADEVASDLALCWRIARDDRVKAGVSPPVPH